MRPTGVHLQGQKFAMSGSAPKSYGFVIATRRQGSAVWCERHLDNSGFRSGKLGNLGTGSDIPKPRRIVIGAAGQELAVRRKGQAHNSPPMALEDRALFARRQVPKPDGVIR